MSKTLIFTILFLSTFLCVHSQWTPPTPTQSQLQSLSSQSQLNSPTSPLNQPTAATTTIYQTPLPQLNAAPATPFNSAVQTNAVNQATSPLAVFSQHVGLSQLHTAQDAIGSATQNPLPQQPQQPAAINNLLPVSSNSLQTQQLPMMNNVAASMPSMNSPPTQPQQQTLLLSNAAPTLTRVNAAMTTNPPLAELSSAPAAMDPLLASVPQSTLSSSTIPNISPSERASIETAATQSTAPTAHQAVSTFQVNQVAAPYDATHLLRFTRPLPRQNVAFTNTASQQQQSLQTPSASSSMFAPSPQQPGVESVAAQTSNSN